MPTYEYQCGNKACGNAFEVVKKIADIDHPESCDRCGDVASRTISRSHFYGASDWNKLEYNPGLGQWVQGGSKARAKICRERGLTEVGNEDPERIAKHQEDKLNTILEDNWNKV